MKRPQSTIGMRHVALFVQDLAAAEHFYVDLMGMQVEWRPDEDNVYLNSGSDNVALHRATEPPCDNAQQRLDHIGFFIQTPELVDEWFAFLKENGVKMRTDPISHRDGARSFYCYDPAGTTVQIIYHPPIVAVEGSA